MNYELLKKYNFAIALDNVLQLKWRVRLQKIFFDLALISFVCYGIFTVYAPEYTNLMLGLTLISLGLSLLLLLLQSFYYDLYFDDLQTGFREYHFRRPATGGSYIAAEILSNAKTEDVAIGLLQSAPGKLLCLRLGIPLLDTVEFISKKQSGITLNQLSGEAENTTNSFENILSSLYKQDKEFKEFIFKYSIRERELIGAANWIVKQTDREKRSRRWWGRDNLVKVSGLGTDWSNGRAFALEKYAQRIEYAYDFSAYGLGHHRKEIFEMESILSKGKESNLFLVADDDFQKIDLLVEFAKKMMTDKLPSIKNKVIYVIDINDVLMGKKTKAEFEEEIIEIFSGAERAGNIILFIKNLTSSIVNSNALQSDLLGLIGPYLDSPSLSIVAVSDTKSFHLHIENNLSVTGKFEIMLLKGDAQDNLIYTLEKRTTELEQKYKIIFTYPALVAITENVSRYFAEQLVSDKAIDILIELPRFALKQNKTTITKAEVLKLIQTKTGIPVGEIKEKEKDKLLNLEKILHERVIGQNEAIVAIGGALRRGRSGIESANKPMGSFLFLGPTGVGKTETAKALSQVFFDNDKKIIRLDMSEYSGDDSMSRLLGSFETGKQGILTSLLRENQYGVLLLDEFEKANHEVHNLFLQILDEGIFSDMVGTKVNARNLIIIATSNAGSDIIWDYVKESKSLVENKQGIIDQIIHRGLFKPELINRFDGVVLFHPLNNDQLTQIAVLMLKKLSKRLEEKGLELIINDELVNYLVKKGGDPLFGARPINRAIQDNVEEIIARKMISGEIKPGTKIEITKEDLELIK